MDEEPHHHLALRNDFAKVFAVQVSPGDSIVLHRHDQDTIAIAIGNQTVTVGVPGKPDIHQMNADAQVRLQRSGYVHSTRVDGATPYHTVAVELLRPQANFRNLCAAVLASEPLHCSTTPAKLSSASSSDPLLESDQTRVRLVRVRPHRSMNLTGSSDSDDASRLIVVLDAASISADSPKELEKALRPGDFVWLDGGHQPARVFRNTSSKEVRFVDIAFLRVP